MAEKTMIEEGLSPEECERLACVSCRARKLKCDRRKPICTRCSKVKNNCVYPEARRKPAFKRRNVKELEARLAQVEVMLNEAKATGGLIPNAEDSSPDAEGGVDPCEDGALLESFDMTEEMINSLASNTMPFSDPPQLSEPAFQSSFAGVNDSNTASSSYELIGLGQLESLPPFEVIEELHKIFFQSMYHFVPLIHPTKYIQSFHSAPHLRPPMCLQYAIWTVASNGHEKYGGYHDIFYQRARRYLEVDELKGFGEQFITVQHAQAWILVTTDEARCLLFTRSGMGAARAMRLCEMLGLHRLDGERALGDVPDVLPSPSNWIELEERRRTFWAAFCVDSHASVSTGWPNLIDSAAITTHLPSSEDAFITGKPEVTGTLDNALNGGGYSGFASSILTCEVFNLLLKHIHRSKPNDGADNIEYGAYWTRHRDLDNTLSSLFMFLPENYKLPKSLHSPVAVHTNLNLHASVIVLQTSALEKISKHNLPETLKETVNLRLLTSAREVVNIMKLTSHLNAVYRSPLVALALYCAACVFIYQTKDNASPDPTHIQNLEFIIKCMEAIAREHVITRAFLQQVVHDIDNNGVRVTMQLPFRDKPSALPAGACIPLLARSALMQYSEMAQLLPGWQPHKPTARSSGARHPWEQDTGEKSSGCWPAYVDPVATEATNSMATHTAGTNKRRRVISPEPGGGPFDMSMPNRLYQSVSSWLPPGGANEFRDLENDTTITAQFPGMVPNATRRTGFGTDPAKSQTQASVMSLPHRSQPSNSASPNSSAIRTGNNSSEPSPPALLQHVNTVSTEQSDDSPATELTGTTIDEVYAAASSFARIIETGGLGGLNDLSQFGEFQDHLASWDGNDTESLYLRVQDTLGHGTPRNT